MNHEKPVIHEEVSTSSNLLPKIFGRKNKIEYNSSFSLNLQADCRTCLTPLDIYIGLYRHGTISKLHDALSSPLMLDKVGHVRPNC
jgi:hypothetical protein